MVLGGRRATSEVVGEVGVDREVDDELGSVGRRERGKGFQETGVLDPAGRVEDDALDNPAPVGSKVVGRGVVLQARFQGEGLVGGPGAFPFLY